MKNITYIAIFLFLSQLAHSDELCNQIEAFANQAEEKELLSVTLVTNWSEFSKSCTHNNSKPGKLLCKYLNEHTSTEFMNINVSRVLSCISNGMEQTFNNELIYQNIKGTVYSYSMKNVNENITVSVEYSFGFIEELPKLTISAENEGN